jgi:LmbE family N-acetylglucosaminyl deacetylase
MPETLPSVLQTDLAFWRYPMPCSRCFSALLIFAVLINPAVAAVGRSQTQPDDRYKSDLLLIIGHPDDETFIAGYLARVAFDQHKRISVIICNSSQAGGNVYGPESAEALAAVQIVEGHKAFASLGVENVWFISGRDTASQNVLWSLENWNHGRVLGEVVRPLRLTRPEVVLSELPAQVAGENHGDHQAAGVLATEAFDVAGDPTAFPEQVAPARALRGVGNLTEGLRPWQAKKIYYFTDAFDNISQYWSDPREVSPFRPNFLMGAGPSYANADISPAKGVSYGKLAAIEASAYVSQGGVGDRGRKALEEDNWRAFENPVRLIFGKSVKAATATEDVFSGISPEEASFAPVTGYHSEAPPLGLRFSEAREFYRHFWQAHDLDRVARLLPVPEAAVGAGETLVVPMIFFNHSASPVEVTIEAKLPSGWTVKEPVNPIYVEAHTGTDIQAIVSAPSSEEVAWQELHWTARVNGAQAGSARMRILTGRGGLPQ